MILLDTNVISELVKPAPDPAVTAYVNSLPPETVFTAAICVAEIRYGLARMPAGQRRDGLIMRMTTFLALGFQDQILPFDHVCAALYGEIRHAREAAVAGEARSASPHRDDRAARRGAILQERATAATSFQRRRARSAAGRSRDSR